MTSELALSDSAQRRFYPRTTVPMLAVSVASTVTARSSTRRPWGPGDRSVTKAFVVG